MKAVEVDITNEAIDYTWSSSFLRGIIDQLDKCSNEHDGCSNCPARFKCEKLWDHVSQLKNLTVSDFRRYSFEISRMREPKKTWKLSRI